MCFNPLQNVPAKQTMRLLWPLLVLVYQETDAWVQSVLSANNVKTNLCSWAALVNPLSPPPSRSLQRPRGTALPGKRPHAHVCQVSLHLPATSRCRTGVQSCTEGHAVSGPGADLVSNLSRLKSQPRKSVCCHVWSLVWPFLHRQSNKVILWDYTAANNRKISVLDGFAIIIDMLCLSFNVTPAEAG